MENFINSNPGLKSRFNKYIEFPDYTIDELMGIFDMNCKKYDYETDEEVRAQIRAMIVQRKLGALENYANARDVRNLFEEIITNQARRVAAMESPTQEDMKKILLEDLEETAAQDAQKVMEKAGKTQAAGITEAEKSTGGEPASDVAETEKSTDGKPAADAAETDRSAGAEPAQDEN
jgi:predicted house-cleaning noncanonical NTP pyrophosphatase (MazG superfamily)